MLTALAVHCAKKVTDVAETGIVFDAFAVIEVPVPFAAVFQPENV